MLDKSAAAEKFGLIDSYGVLHHLEDPQQGLNALTARLAEGGIIRVMVYSRYARKEEDSIRRAFSLLGIRDTATARRLIKQAKPGSRLYSFAKSSYEAQSNSGLADALLHPSVKSYRIDEFVKLVHGSGLQLLRFAHDQALEDRNAEIARIRRMESDRQSPGNFVAFLGQNTNRAYPSKSNAVLQLNPCLIGSISRPRVSGLTIPPRLGMDNPPLDSSARRFLKRFISPVRIDQLTPEDYIRTAVYRKALFLLQYNP
jgi:SAM-dependent methyltransferase